MTRSRALLATALLPLLSACSAVVPIDLTRDVDLEAAAGAFELDQPIDLTAEPDVWSHRNQVDAVSIDEVSATVLSVGAGNGAATVTFTLRFRPDGAPADGSQDLAVGTLPALPVVADATASLPGSSDLDAFLLSTLHGSGRFTALASGSLSAPASAVVRLEVKGSAAYKLR
jgi:hypothetical protein